MIKFFRKIRQKLLSENKFSKYLLYAIGEIVLVVIGILIALQINNWNESRKQEVEQIKLLQNFKNSIVSDIESFDHYIEEYGTIHNSINIIQNHLNDDLPFSTSLNFHFLNSTAYWAQRIDQGVFSTLSSTDLSIISNDSLKKEIVSYYTFAKTNFDMKMAKYSKIIDNASENLFSTRFDGLWNTTESAMIPHDFEALKKDKEYKYFINSLNQQIFWLVEEPLTNADKKAKNLLQLIDEELNTLEK
ncbi:MAG TPA: hypothetical protein DCS66_03545 [Flavobacteriaceae bacterium]|nr:hypothetical protein [Flavobacteriaceae bacterium]|tara:strand:- start:175 stop:912 length:738 start_codon:yes stop_codon:yes gene_type:complete